MSVARSRELIVPLSAIAIVAALSIVAAVLSAPGSSGLPPGSSFSKDASGSAAAYLTLEAIAPGIRRSFDAISLFAADPSDTVLILASPTERASEQDRRALQAFIARGGIVLVTGCEGASFIADGAATAGEEFSAAREFAVSLPSPIAEGAPRISMASPCRQPLLGPPYVTLYGDDRAQVVKAARIGEGLVVWWAGNTPLSNSSIDAPGHLELLLNIAGGDRTIVWDEFYHGQRRSLWSYARPTPLPWALAQLALAALVAGAMYVRRRMPVREPYAESRTSPLEFVETMATLYRRAKSAREAAMTARHRLRRLLAEATGLAPGVSDDRIADAAAARFPVDRGALRRALREAEEAGAAPAIEPARALAVVRQLQRFAAAVDHRGG
jgi:hypothetical protein